jgi:hypothetical protein
MKKKMKKIIQVSLLVIIDSVDSIKLQKIRKIVSPDITYNKIKYKNDIFSLGDCLLVRDQFEGFLIGKLIKIIPSGGFKKYPYWPTIQIQW